MLIKSLKPVVIFLVLMVGLSMQGCQMAKQIDKQADSQAAKADIEISSLADLSAFRDRARDGESFMGKTILLKNDIDIIETGKPGSEEIGDTGVIRPATSFEPFFGVSEEGFKGTFDGDGKCLKCNLTNLCLEDGLFGNVAKGGVLKNLKVTGNFEGYIDSPFINKNEGTIHGCLVDATARDILFGISGICIQNEGTIDNCEVRGEFYTNDMGCAGICYGNDGEIIDCKVSAKLVNCVKSCSPDPSYKFQLPETGGIASFNMGLVKGCVVESDLLSEFEGVLEGSVGGVVCSIH